MPLVLNLRTAYLPAFYLVTRIFRIINNAETKASARSLNNGVFSYLWLPFVAPDGDPRRKITELLGVVISLSVTNPRITEWLRPESVFRLSADTFDSCNFQTVQNNTRFLAILRIDKGVLHNSGIIKRTESANKSIQ